MERSWRGIACLQRPHREFQDSTDRETGPRLTPLLEQVEKLRVLKLMPDWSIQTKKSWVFKRKAQEEEDTIDHKGCQGSHIGNLYLFMTLGFLHRHALAWEDPAGLLAKQNVCQGSGTMELTTVIAKLLTCIQQQLHPLSHIHKASNFVDCITLKHYKVLLIHVWNFCICAIILSQYLKDHCTPRKSFRIKDSRHF